MQKFSVAMSVYKNDNPIYFDRALESITDQQTIKPDEIVLVEDGPVPQEIDSVIEKYSKKYNIKLIKLEKNGGLGNALKIATENCSNELIARMDSDDISNPLRFELQLKYFDEHSDVDVLGGQIEEFINSEDNVSSIRYTPLHDNDIKKFAKSRCPFNHMTVMFKKQSVISSGNYVEVKYNEDYYLWVRMHKNNCTFTNLNCTLSKVRSGPEQFKRRGGLIYFKSELFIQKYLFKNKIISFPRFCINIIIRFVAQCLIPNSFRNFLYLKILRKNK